MAPPESFESVFAIDAQDGGSGIPERPEDITPDLISRAFASSHPGAEAAAVTAAAGSRMQALEIGMRSMKRSTDAIVELETPELFRQELGLS